jgi:uncharacterized protein (DUF924 family)
MSAGTIDEIVAFWFETLKPEDWYRKNPAIDAAITERFSATYEALKDGRPAGVARRAEGNARRDHRARSVPCFVAPY